MQELVDVWRVADGEFYSCTLHAFNKAPVPALAYFKLHFTEQLQSLDLVLQIALQIAQHQTNVHPLRIRLQICNLHPEPQKIHELSFQQQFADLAQMAQVLAALAQLVNLLGIHGKFLGEELGRLNFGFQQKFHNLKGQGKIPEQQDLRHEVVNRF